MSGAKKGEYLTYEELHNGWSYQGSDHPDKQKDKNQLMVSSSLDLSGKTKGIVDPASAESILSNRALSEGNVTSSDNNKNNFGIPTS